MLWLYILLNYVCWIKKKKYIFIWHIHFVGQIQLNKCEYKFNGVCFYWKIIRLGLMRPMWSGIINQKHINIFLLANLFQIQLRLSDLLNQLDLRIQQHNHTFIVYHLQLHLNVVCIADALGILGPKWKSEHAFHLKHTPEGRKSQKKAAI